MEGREGQKCGINGMLLTKCEVHFFTMLPTISQPSVQDCRSIKCDCVRVHVCVFVCVHVCVRVHVGAYVCLRPETSSCVVFEVELLVTEGGQMNITTGGKHHT